MKKSVFKIFFVSILALSLSVLVSCKDKVMGYSVVLWNLPEYSLQDGDVVPVYIRSNISHVYVAGAPDGQKIEIPLWQLTEPEKKGKIGAEQKKYAEFAHNYASVKLDGLPCRAEPVNTAKQVYRLRKGEVIKLLYKGKGQAVMAGKNALEGDWFKILTSNGTQGWCFSYNLNIFQTDVTGQKVGGEELVEEDTADSLYDSILNKAWYPDSYQTMISTGNIDVSRLRPSYNFMIDTENNKVSLNMSGIHESWNYEGYTKTDDYQYTLKNIPIVIIYKKAAFIVARYTGEDGKPQELNLVTIDVDINELVESERSRRAQAYSNIVNHGGSLSSSSYGNLTLNEDGTFIWNNFKLLVPSVISASAKNSGTVGVKYSVSKSLAESYSGVLTFNFAGMDKEVNFLYKIEDGGLRLEDATGAKMNGILVTERGSSPLIVYFKIK